MIKPPSPPAGANEYLSQLAQYYRELVEYHQQAAMAAEQQLGHVQALLGEQSVLTTTVEGPSWMLDESHQKRKVSSPSSPSNIPMLPQYRGLSKEKALKKFFKNTPDKAVSIWEITEALYGQLNLQQTRRMRDAVRKALWYGKNKGLWSSVPGKIGVYQAKKPHI